MRYTCCDERRREAVRATGVTNGIDFLEVLDQEAPSEADRQLLLHLHVINPPTGELAAITPANFRISGGVRVTGIVVTSVGAWNGDVLEVRVNQPGDYATYTLSLVGSGGAPLPGLDPFLAAVDFSFKVECPSELDCQVNCQCQPETEDAPEIDYLARDYASFRRLLLDRLAATVPDWRERNPADLGLALVEVLAYAADHLSYQLDAVGMEATLATARRRASAARHARLVDYRVSHGANARTWAQVRVPAGANGLELPAGTRLLTGVPGIGEIISPGSDEYRRALDAGATVFETMEPALLYAAQNELHFYTWGDRDCCLPAGATRATLRGRREDLQLAVGRVLVFQEQCGPRTGAAADADPGHRHAVRLTAVMSGEDRLGSWFADPLAPLAATPVTEIVWGEEDSLPFPLCVSATSDTGETLEDVSVALGNIVPADHGWTIDDPEPLPPVPEPDERLAVAPPGASCHCQRQPLTPAPPRYRPGLARRDLTMSAATRCVEPAAGPGAYRPGYRRRGAPAAAALFAKRRRERPAICVTEEASDRLWQPRRDLLSSSPFSREFVVESEAGGVARLRFGDDEYGMRPAAGVTLRAVYRVGNGAAGNIGANALSHIVFDTFPVDTVTNPLPARGGADAETIEHVRQIAPSAFRVPQRAVTADDYASVAGRHSQVQQATATERWTGSWHTVFLTIDRRGGRTVDAAFESELRVFLERFRMAGHDLEIDGPRFVPLEIELRVCVLPDYYRSDVKQALLTRFSRGLQPDGQPGFFHPDNLSFGQPVYLSRIVAVAQETPGVRFVEPLVFQRQGDAQSSALATGVLPLGRLEIARLDNDHSFPERGVLRLTMEGGQ
jgi:hypothetical protein